MITHRVNKITIIVNLHAIIACGLELSNMMKH